MLYYGNYIVNICFLVVIIYNLKINVLELFLIVCEFLCCCDGLRCGLMLWILMCGFKLDLGNFIFIEF